VGGRHRAFLGGGGGEVRMVREGRSPCPIMLVQRGIRRNLYRGEQFLAAPGLELVGWRRKGGVSIRVTDVTNHRGKLKSTRPDSKVSRGKWEDGV